LRADGAHDIHTQLGLSGEPLIPDLEGPFTLKDPISLLEYQDLTVKGLEYESEYSDYWNSTAEEDGKSLLVVQKPKGMFV
jgi:amidase